MTRHSTRAPHRDRLVAADTDPSRRGAHVTRRPTWTPQRSHVLADHTSDICLSRNGHDRQPTAQLARETTSPTRTPQRGGLSRPGKQMGTNVPAPSDQEAT